MKIKSWLILAAAVILCCFLLTGCGNKAKEEAEVAEATLTPEPTPVITEYTVTDETAEEIEALADIETLKTVDATQSTEYEAILDLYNARPDCDITWNYEFQGTVYPSDTETLKVTDLTGLEDALRYLPALTYVDLIDSPATVDDMDRFNNIRPDIDYYWSFVLNGFRMRTDITVYSTLRDGTDHRFTTEEVYPLKFCKHLRALDLGHNNIDDISWISGLTEINVLILADNPFKDASPLKNLTKVFYLELFMCHGIENFDFLYDMPEMKDLNLCYVDTLENLDFLSVMPDMEFGMFKYSNISDETIAYWSEQLPNAYITNYDGSIHSCAGGWRDTETNFLIRYAFAAWRNVTGYNTYDDVTYDFETYNYDWA